MAIVIMISTPRGLNSKWLTDVIGKPSPEAQAGSQNTK